MTRVRSLDFTQMVYMAQLALRGVMNGNNVPAPAEIDWIVGRLQEAFPLTPPTIVGRASNYLISIYPEARETVR